MSRKKLVFLGSKAIGFQCFEHLLAVKDTLDIEITCLLTQNRSEFSGSDLATLAKDHSIPIADDLSDLPECDILYSVQYHKILKQDHINKAGQIAVNLHMAPLPEYRGCNQFSFAIMDGKTEFGTTIHRIDARIDHGDILFQKRFNIPEDCWVKDLYDLTHEASLALFKETLPDTVKGNYKLIPQQSLETEYGTALHFRKEIAELKQINLDWDKEVIEKRVRATSMPGFEPPYFLIGDERVYLERRQA